MRESAWRLFEAARHYHPSPRMMQVGRLCGLALTIASVVLVVVQGVNEIDLTDWRSIATATLVTLAAYGLSFLLQAVGWSLLIGRLSHEPGGWWDIEIYAYSNLMRRAPGAIWYLVDRVQSYRDRGLAGRFTLAASGSEWGLLVLSSAVVYGLTYLVSSETFLLVGSAVLGIVTLSLSVLIVQRRATVRTEPLAAAGVRGRLGAAVPELVLVGFLYAICNVLGGVILYELAHIVGPTSTLSLTDAVRFWALTVLVSTLGSMVIVLNVFLRDVAIVVSLMSLLPPAAAITVAALLRVVFAVADVFYSTSLFGLARLMRSRVPMPERN